jgi:hypothetical protein
VWQPIRVASAAALARRWIISKALLRAIGRSEGLSPKERPFGLLRDPCRPNVLVKVSLEAVVHRHLVVFAALLVEPEPPTLALGEVVLDPHRQRRADPGKTVDQNTDERTIAQPDQAVCGDALKERPRLLRREDRRPALGDDVLGSSHRSRSSSTWRRCACCSTGWWSARSSGATPPLCAPRVFRGARRRRPRARASGGRARAGPWPRTSGRSRQPPARRREACCGCGCLATCPRRRDSW